MAVTASYLAQVIRDNPELIAWLQKEMPNEQPPNKEGKYND